MPSIILLSRQVEEGDSLKLVLSRGVLLRAWLARKPALLRLVSFLFVLDFRAAFLLVQDVREARLVAIVRLLPERGALRLGRVTRRPTHSFLRCHLLVLR